VYCIDNLAFVVKSERNDRLLLKDRLFGFVVFYPFVFLLVFHCFAVVLFLFTLVLSFFPEDQELGLCHEL
jgi:hypothetical protein